MKSTLSPREDRAATQTDRETRPRTGNTGASRPQPATAAPPLLIDWLEYTAPDGTPWDELLPGYDELDWQELPHGQNGYQKGRASGSIRIYYDGNPGMGAHVSLSGAGCRELEASPCLQQGAAGWVGLLGHVRGSDWKISRIDVAVDDRAGELDFDAMAAAVAAGHVTGPWHKREEVTSWGRGGQYNGRSLYFGSAQSDRRVRIYDKALEQLAKDRISRLPSAPAPEHWIRVEMQTRDEHAGLVADLIIEGKGDMGPVLGMMRQYVDFKEPGRHSNKRRWASAPWWAAFFAGAAKRRLGVQPAIRTLDDVSRWVTRQVAPSLALLVRAAGGNRHALWNLVADGDERLRPRHLALLAS